MKRILFVAAENAALPGGKAGGVGDVVRDLPIALADEGWSPTIIIPAYGALHKLPGAQEMQRIKVAFAGRRETAVIWQIPGADGRLTHLVIEHKLFSPQGAGKIYCDDGDDRPFATDAGKFAFFCAAVAAFVNSMQDLPDVVHLHDWHAALLLALREYDPKAVRLKGLRCVYTIHNLALQGIRPLRDDVSALESWFPALKYDEQVVGDPRYADCFNPMATAIRLADKLNTVSPTYAQEIIRPSNPATGFSGGEGLEREAQQASTDGRLIGILNGCMYPSGRKQRRSWKRLAEAIRNLPENIPTAPDRATVLRRFAKRRPEIIMTSVGRITTQKVQLLLEETAPGVTALEQILQQLGEGSLLVALGNGNVELERRLQAVFARCPNGLFICGYNEVLADTMYECGDLFLMPSSFEPCGISQMLAMRRHQPCVVHGVGGLRDTVSDGRTGFVFTGATPQKQAAALVTAVKRALSSKRYDPVGWGKLRRAAGAERFSWAQAAKHYIAKLYESKNAPAA